MWSPAFAFLVMLHTIWSIQFTFVIYKSLPGFGKYRINDNHRLDTLQSLKYSFQALNESNVRG